MASCVISCCQHFLASYFSNTPAVTAYFGSVYFLFSQGLLHAEGLLRTPARNGAAGLWSPMMCSACWPFPTWSHKRVNSLLRAGMISLLTSALVDNSAHSVDDRSLLEDLFMNKFVVNQSLLIVNQTGQIPVYQS